MCRGSAAWAPEKEGCHEVGGPPGLAPRPDQSPGPTTRPKRRGRILKSGGLVPVGDGVGDVDQVVGDSLNI